jgi:hypothetical protein
MAGDAASKEIKEQRLKLASHIGTPYFISSQSQAATK